MSLYSEKLDTIIESLQVNEKQEEKETKLSVNLNSHSREFKNIQFRSHMYKNTQVKNQEKQVKVKEDKVKDYLDTDQTNVYNRPWNKLENGFKKNRICLFINKEIKENNLTIEEREKLKNLLYQAIDNKEINTKNDVNYDEEKCNIIEIFNLEYDKINGYHIQKKEYKKKKTTVKNDNSKFNLMNTLIKKTESNKNKKKNDIKKIHEHLNHF